jgi:hypothetical protein
MNQGDVITGLLSERDSPSGYRFDYLAYLRVLGDLLPNLMK